MFSFFFNDTATTEIYTLSLHDALPIFRTTTGVRWTKVNQRREGGLWVKLGEYRMEAGDRYAVRVTPTSRDRKSTRLNSSHANISYAVFCLKKKKILIYLFSHIL